MKSFGFMVYLKSKILKICKRPKDKKLRPNILGAKFG
jgi:hypothetical protein